MQRDLVEQRQWFTESEYRQGAGVCEMRVASEEQVSGAARAGSTRPLDQAASRSASFVRAPVTADHDECSGAAPPAKRPSSGR
jgi:hypothetical protein